MIRKLYLLLISLILYLQIGCLDPYFEKSIKIYGDIYLLQPAGTSEFYLTYQTSENYYTNLIGPEVLEIVKNDAKIFIKQRAVDSVIYYRINVNDKYIRNSLTKVSSIIYENNKLTRDSKVMYVQKR